MIAIVNTGTVNQDGEHVYRLQINEYILCRFTHARPDGLAACLEKAAAAARIYEEEEEKTRHDVLIKALNDLGGR